MKRVIFVHALVALVAMASPELQALGAPAPQSTRDGGMQNQSAYNIQQNAARMQQDSYNAQQNTDRQTSINSVANLIKLRGKLAEAWQSLGLSPAVAKEVAAAYQPNFSSSPRRTSLEGKTDGEIAALIQSSLAKKDYLLANQTLIDFQTKKMKLGKNVLPEANH